jgi:hypothetical protein
VIVPLEFPIINPKTARDGDSTVSGVFDVFGTSAIERKSRYVGEEQ